MKTLTDCANHPCGKLIISLSVGKYSTGLWGTFYAGSTICQLANGNSKAALTFLALTIYQAIYFLVLCWLKDHQVTLWRGR